ncbi:ABC transporter substrate-binding protein [Micromonospora echinofusca]|uniref:ABC transporter substrate-binding protein n=1 Tax=Micromonospora echinofusca TaxID=47858 RepID=UPI0037221DDD
MLRRTPRIFAATLAVAALALGACAEKSSDDTPAAGASSAGAAFPVTVGTVTLEKRPEKIVSLSPTATEMLFAIGAGKQVTAVDDQSNFPADAPKSDLSGFTPNAEAIAGKSPDLVVLSDDRNKIVDQLTTLKIPVYLTPAATTLDDSYRQITDLGTLTGHADEAADVTKRMKDDITKLVADLPKRAEKLTYYHELGPELYTATSKTFIGSLYTLVGLENIADASDADGKQGGYPQLSQEVIVKADPDFVFLADTKCCKQSAETVKARAGWAGVMAVKNNQVVGLDDDVASRWGPRVVDLLRVIVDATAKVPA